ncbi:hypothetical protein V1290_000007 [Bradyrhizobium sp. AZCC 1578]|uniref:hypothetical protein n=1 Tax=Bradyrhizobium sp. AZCC 1578 TaxID=3117027 RepID=UPI002FF0BBD6
MRRHGCKHRFCLFNGERCTMCGYGWFWSKLAWLFLIPPAAVAWGLLCWVLVNDQVVR